jgi:hypothetical protein
MYDSTTRLINSTSTGHGAAMTAVLLHSFAVNVLRVRTEVPSCKSHFSRHSATLTTLTDIYRFTLNPKAVRRLLFEKQNNNEGGGYGAGTFVALGLTERT